MLWLLAVAQAYQRLRFNGELPVRGAASPRADGFYLFGSNDVAVTYNSVPFGPTDWGANGVGHLTNDATVTLTVEHHSEPTQPMAMRMFCLERAAVIQDHLFYVNVERLGRKVQLQDGCTCTAGGVDQGYPCPAGPLPAGESRQVVSCPIFRGAADAGPWPGGSLPCTIGLLGDVVHPQLGTYSDYSTWYAQKSGLVDVWVHHSTADMPPSPPPGALAGAHPGVYEFADEYAHMSPGGGLSCHLLGSATVPDYAPTDASISVALDAAATLCGPDGTNVSVDATLELALGVGGRHEGVLRVNGGDYEFVLDEQRLSYSLVDFGSSPFLRAGYAAQRGPPPPSPPPPFVPNKAPMPPPWPPPVPPMPFASELDDGSVAIVILVVVAVVLALLGIAAGLYFTATPSSKDGVRDYRGV